MQTAPSHIHADRHADVDADARAASADPVRVVVADDELEFTRLLAAVIGAEPTLQLVASAAGADEAVRSAMLHEPDVVLVDVRMPSGGGPRVARELGERLPRTHVLALSGSGERESVVEMLRAGAVGYLVKGCSNAQLVDAIHRAARGEGDISPELARDMVGELSELLAREQDDATRRSQQRARVERVLRDDLIRVAFQPIVDLQTGEIRGVEALARFPVEPVRGPAEWFADASRAGLLIDLELAAIRAALVHLSDLPRHVRMTFNASPMTARSSQLADLIAPHAGRRLTLEITEHAPVDDYDAMAAALDPLRDQGLQLAIDDAGAGFASLRHILLLRPDVIKVDMTLTRGIEADRSKRALARALIGFAAEIGADIVAEGIETPSEQAALAALGVRYGQGYHLGRVAPLESALSPGGFARR